MPSSYNSMRLVMALLITVPMNTGCSYVAEDDVFEVRSEDVMIKGSRAVICGRSFNGTSTGKVSVGKFQVGCSDSLRIAVDTDHGTSVCSVGYIAADESAKRWVFELRGGSCKLTQ